MFIFGLIWNALIACNSFPILLAAKRCKYLNIKHDHINWTISILSIALLLFYSVFSKFTKPQRQNHANNYNKLNGVFCIVTTILMFSCGDGVT